MKLQIETKRLLLREWRRDDLIPFIRLNKDPRVMEHFHRKPDKAEILDLFTRIRDEIDMFGFGLFAVERLDTGRFIGFVGLHRFDLGADSRPGTEIAWRLMPEAWGNGYATEAAEACLVYARQELGLNEIYSFAPKVNKRSERVMQKLGMFPIKEFDHPAIPTGHTLARHIIYCTVMPDAKKRGVIDVGDVGESAQGCDSVALFVNGYWNTGRKALRLGSVFFNRLGVEMRDAIVENIGDVPLRGYWEEEFIEKAKDHFRTRFKGLDGTAIASVAPIFIDGSGDWDSSGKSRFKNGLMYGRDILMHELKALGVTDNEGHQRKSIFVVSHSMGAAYSEGIIKHLCSSGMTVSSVLHFSAADNTDFTVGLPDITYQVNIVPDIVLFYKNMPDRIAVTVENMWERLKEKVGRLDEKDKPEPYQIPGLICNHYIDYDNGMDMLNHYYTKSKHVWQMIDFDNLA